MRLVSVLGIATLAVSINSHALELSVSTGYDDNPYSMGDAYSGSQFVELQLSHQGRTEGKAHLRYSLDVDLDKHEDSKADSLNAKARLRWVQPFSLFDRSSSLLMTADIGTKQRDYVDQLTGEIALTRDGKPIEQRYNYQYGKLSVEGILRFDRYKSIAVYAYAEKRDYTEDYAALNLESLDYREVGFQPSFRWKTERGTYLRAMAFIRNRDYLGLLDDDITGINVEGSTVDYQLTGLSVLLKHPFTEHLSSSIYAVGYEARDDYKGMRDLDAWQLKGTISYTFDNKSLISIEAGINQRAYINDRQGRQNPEERIPGKEQRLLSTTLTYMKPLPRISEQLSFHVTLQHERVNNSDARRSYSNNRFSMGLTYQW